MAEQVDPVRWSYKEMIDTFPAYHEGTGDARPLRDFAERLPAGPAVASRPREARAPARAPKAAPKPSEEAPGRQAPLKPRRGGGGGGGAAAGSRLPEVLPLKAPAASVAPRGPVPQPFAAAAPEPGADEEEADEEEGAAEPAAEQLSLEQYAEWMKYYRECREYFEQCEKNCALEAGVEPPSRPPPPGSGQAESQARPATTALGAAARGPEARLPMSGLEAPPALGMAPNLGSFMPPSLPEGLGMTPQPLLQALQSLQMLQQQQQLQMLQLQQVQQLVTGSLLNGGLLGGLGGGLLGLPGPLQAQAPAASNLSNEMLANLLMAWYYSGYYTGEYAAKQGQP